MTVEEIKELCREAANRGCSPSFSRLKSPYAAVRSAASESFGEAPGEEPNALSELEQLDRLMAQADQGDAEAAEAVHRIFADDQGVWRKAGDLAELALATILATLDQTPAVVQSIRHKLQRRRDELVDENTTELQQMQLDRLVLAWASATVIDLHVTSAGGVASPAMLKAQESAERRCQTALRSLEIAGQIAKAARKEQLGRTSGTIRRRAGLRR